MSIRYLKKFGDLKLKCSITWIVQLFDLIWYKNVELKLKVGSNNTISFFNFVIWIEFVTKNWIKNGQFGTKT